MIYNTIEDLIGNTPLLKINAQAYGIKNTNIYVKMEYMNPFGSIKDRTAKSLLDSVDTSVANDLIESSSGNTAKALRLLGGRKGLKLTSVTNRIKIPEVEQQLKYIGTQIISLPGKSECPDPNDDNNALTTIERMIRESPNRYIHTSQYSNHANTEIHFQTTAREIYEDLQTVDMFFTGVGTGGSSGGIIRFAHEYDKEARFIGIVAEPSDFLPGIRNRNELFETELFDENLFHEIIEVTSRDALDALRKLVIQEGVLAGPTTGANFSALLEYVHEHDKPHEDGTKKTAVFIACDRLEPYMSYIAKRQPELFNASTKNDVYTTLVSDDEPSEYNHSVDKSTIDWIEQSNAIVIDTRGTKPYSLFHIKNSLNFPEELLKETLELGSPFGDRPVLFVCPRGDRSMLLAKILRGRGHEAFSLKGGLVQWRAAGLPLERRLHNEPH